MTKLVCKNFRKVAFAPTGPREALFTRLRCKLWSCEACAITNAWIWRQWLLKRIPEVAEEWWILTLTANSQTRSMARSMDNIRSHLDAFFKRVARVFGKVQYVRVFEKHPTSEAVHCHVIICGLSPFVAVGVSTKLRYMAIGVSSRSTRNGVWAIKTWIKKIAQELEMGYIADIQKIVGDAQKAVWYVTKYLTKDQSAVHVIGLRHVQVTTGIGSPPKQGSDLTWLTAAYVTADMVGEKTKMEDLQTHAIIDQNHWELHTFYPHED